VPSYKISERMQYLSKYAFPTGFDNRRILGHRD
jgi:hypothetical protein